MFQNILHPPSGSRSKKAVEEDKKLSYEEYSLLGRNATYFMRAKLAPLFLLASSFYCSSTLKMESL
jgi:hypothetical protein